ncbi:metalloregulator ArsR/SmtB family transcription factor [Fructobacillus sp. M1-13]|uniref:Winged helix-turn-helix transcriptional regulator n=1 Tax=Fructobacillus papyriferae TaxID=2713171 RepID=A0ABS5QQQ3_9LACO|nr:metalloregulator ArsR/SmtB family transcription factor [Fructobacillus papyriferae]MBS9335242.1 winged helix-turn-helix transcriptional regulator [Fructobacillus papyriferae]MCD2159089.1 metalloregulator ArsR/SmtB family transcription factor [Fructobacillus papyriferae]
MKKEIQAELSHIFKLLSSEKRLAILMLLQEKPYSVTELIQVLQMEQSAVSHQLKKLREEQVVAVEKIGRTVYYRLTDSHIIDLLASAEKHVEHVVNNETHEEWLHKKSASFKK